MLEEQEMSNEILVLSDHCYWRGIEGLNKKDGIMSGPKKVEVWIVEVSAVTSVACYLKGSTGSMLRDLKRTNILELVDMKGVDYRELPVSDCIGTEWDHFRFGVKLTTVVNGCDSLLQSLEMAKRHSERNLDD